LAHVVDVPGLRSSWDRSGLLQAGMFGHRSSGLVTRRACSHTALLVGIALPFLSQACHRDRCIEIAGTWAVSFGLAGRMCWWLAAYHLGASCQKPSPWGSLAS
jgi:hypothetical protein